MKSVIKRHEFSMLLLCVWGITTLFATQQVNPIALAVALLGIVFSYLMKRRGYIASPLIANLGAAFMMIFSGIVFFDSGNLLDSTVYLFLFLQVIQFLTARNLRQLRWCYLISFFQIIAGAVLTTGLSFGIFFLGYIFLFLYSLRLYSQREDSLSLRYQENLIANPAATAVPSKSRLILSTLLQAVVILLLTAVIFSLIPRLSTQNQFQPYMQNKQDKSSVTAFDETVKFGSMEAIQQDNAVALYVQPTRGTRAGDHVRLRGVALDTFDGTTWKRTGQNYTVRRQLQFRAFTYKSTDPAEKYHHRILQPPGVTRYLFGQVYPLSLELPINLDFLFDPLSNSASLTEMLPKEIQYDIESAPDDFQNRIDPETFSRHNDSQTTESGPAQLARMLTETMDELDSYRHQRRGPARRSREMPQERGDPETPRFFQVRLRHSERLRFEAYLFHCTELPDSLKTERIRNLANQWTAEAGTPFEKAVAVERYFKTTFGYTLEQKNRGNFIEDFLFRTQEGHCEYFATSMAVLMRNLGIPTRIVNGYYSTEWNDIAGAFTVRHRNAHSWVEVYMGDDYGWMTFDPTPPSGMGNPGNINQFWNRFTKVYDSVRIQWYRYIIDYSLDDQLEGFKKLIRWQRRVSAALPSTSGANRLNLTGGSMSGQLYIFPLILALCAVGGLAYFGIKRWNPSFAFRRKQKRKAVIAFYEQILMTLEKNGHKIKPGQTPREFAAEVESVRPDLFGFSSLTEVYYAIRYNDLPISTETVRNASELNRKILVS